MSTLEQQLARELQEHGEDDFVVEQLRRQITAKDSGQSSELIRDRGCFRETTELKERVSFRATEEDQK